MNAPYYCLSVFSPSNATFINLINDIAAKPKIIKDLFPNILYSCMEALTIKQIETINVIIKTLN